MLTNEDDFKKGLKSNPQQTRLIDALFNQADFRRLWEYLRNCPGFTLTLKVAPGLKILGVERFGGFTSTGACTGILEINPTKTEHVANAAELVDTVVHELIHAICAAKACCRGLDYPLTNGETDWSHDPDRPDPTGLQPRKGDPDSPNKEHAKKHYGDGASDPANEYLDENDKAQELIRKIVDEVLKETARFDRGPILDGGPTLTHINLRKLKGATCIVKNFGEIRSIVYEPDSCWQRTSTARGWIMRCRCTYCIMLVSYKDGKRQVDFVGNGDRVEKHLDSLHVRRIGGFDKP